MKIALLIVALATMAVSALGLWIPADTYVRILESSSALQIHIAVGVGLGLIPVTVRLYNLLSHDKLMAQRLFISTGLLLASGLVTRDWSPISMLAVALPALIVFYLSTLALRYQKNHYRVSR